MNNETQDRARMITQFRQWVRKVFRGQAIEEPDAQEIISLELLGDEPIKKLEQDRLQLKKIAHIIAQVAVGTEGPFTIGLFGGWGEGKTSVLHLAKKFIDETRRAKRGEIITVEFNAWKYEKESFPLIPLIASVINELNKKKHLNDKIIELLKILKKGFRSILFGLSTQFDVNIPGIGGIKITSDVSKSVQREENLRTRWIDKQVEQSLYYNSFQSLQEIQQRAQQKIVIFIDDLDRCFPDKAIYLLENIKLVLSQPGFIFVLAVDQRILENFLEKRFKNEFGFDDYQRGQSYLDKIIQLRFWIQSHQDWFKELVKQCLDRPSLSEYYVALEIETLVIKTNELVEKIASACGYNPRRLIRLVNDLEIAQLINPVKNFPSNAFALAWSLHQHFPNTYNWLLKQNDLCNKLKECRDVDRMKNSLTSLRRELSVDDENDDYFHDLLNENFLLRLLSSEPGRDWLQNRWLQHCADIILQAQREYYKWVQKNSEDALEKLKSEDPDIIASSCQAISSYWGTLVKFDNNKLCPEARKILENLSQHANPRIKNDAIYALKIIDMIPLEW